MLSCSLRALCSQVFVRLRPTPKAKQLAIEVTSEVELALHPPQNAKRQALGHASPFAHNTQNCCRALKPLPVETFCFTKVFPAATQQAQYYEATTAPLASRAAIILCARGLTHAPERPESRCSTGEQVLSACLDGAATSRWKLPRTSPKNFLFPRTSPPSSFPQLLSQLNGALRPLHALSFFLLAPCPMTLTRARALARCLPCHAVRCRWRTCCRSARAAAWSWRTAAAERGRRSRSRCVGNAWSAAGHDCVVGDRQYRQAVQCIQT